MEVTPQGDSAAHNIKYPHAIAITSGKGGVGKSSISVNLAIALSRLGRKVCLFDADAGLANVNILLGLSPQISLEHVLLACKPLRSIMLDGPYGLKVIPGASGITECANMSARHQLHIARELASIEKDYDYLLIDTAAGIGESNLDFIQAAPHTILVITPEPTSLTDAFSMVKVLRRRGKKSHYQVIVNMCSSTKQAREVFHRFAGAVEKHIGVKVNYLGFILQDESLRSAVTMQSPVTLFPETDPSCRNFFRLSEALEASLISADRSSVFSRRWQTLARQRGSRQSQKPPPVLQVTAQTERWQEQMSFSSLRTRLLTMIASGDVPVEEIRALRTALDNAVSIRADVATKPEPPSGAPGIDARYDDLRFGSQQTLLQHLRANRHSSLAELLALDQDN